MSAIAKQARISARGWAMRTSKVITRVLTIQGDEEVDLHLLQYAVDEFDKRLTSLGSCQADFEVTIEDEKELFLDIESAAEYRDGIRKPRIIASKILADSARESVESLKSESVSRTDSAKLPKLTLPHFSGDVLKWTEFWEQFEAIVDSSDMPVVSKYTYLLSLLKGEAKATVQGLSLNAINYKTACDLLKKRFGRLEKIRFSHIQELLSISVAKNAKTSALWEMYNKLRELRGHLAQNSELRGHLR